MKTKIKGKVHVHAFFDSQGKFSSWHLNNYRMDDSAPGEHGMFVFLQTVDVDVEIDFDVNDATVAAARGLDAVVADRIEKHRAMLRDAAAYKNRLLALPAPDIIDAS